MSDPYVDAVKALIDDDVRLHEGFAPPGAEPPYAVLHMGSGTRGRTTLAAVSDRLDSPFQITSVGLTHDGARSVAQRIRAAVLDRRPVIAGRTATPIVQEVAEPMRIDRDVTPHRLYLVDGYAFTTVPAPA